MMRARTITILFASVLALLLCLAACEQKSETPPADPPPAADPVPPAEPPAAATPDIPAEYVAAAETEVTEANAEAVADALEKELEAELAEE